MASLLLSTSVLSLPSLSSACFFSTSVRSLVLLLVEFLIDDSRRPGMVSCPFRLCMMFSLSLRALRRVSSSLAAISFGMDLMEALMPPKLPFFLRLGVLDRDTSMLAIYKKPLQQRRGICMAAADTLNLRRCGSAEPSSQPPTHMP
jgi:hypothetical protein